MADDAVIRDKLRLMFETPGGDVEHAEALYHDDAVLEFPQSGERYEGREAFTAWRSRYPAGVAFTILRVTVRDDLAVVELTASYDGGAGMYGVSIHEFRGGRISLERIYVAEGWDAPDWRKPWRSDRPVHNPGL
ncbi:nuclear transport factor 2 family protein [Agromyces laixinhei]|uniref:nuclear transport factor 2 family protein n=1 Tax=Agromyces laixinhei TaxID=2585717 RepID=UPI0012EDF6DE|nr:nuclear transport factor 2 family protein [Agromyces laixinhei]